VLFDFSNELTSEVGITGKQIIWLAGGGIWDIDVLSLLGEKKKKKSCGDNIFTTKSQ